MVKMVAENQPDELKELSALVKEFVGKLQSIDNEMELLKESRKELLEEYQSKLDTKILNQAIRIEKIRSKVDRKHTLDTFLEILTDPSQ